MIVRLSGHEERYTVEQTLVGLLGGEPVEYGDPSPADRRWAVIALTEADGACRIDTEVGWDGKTASHIWQEPLSGSEYEREGRRRRAMGLCIFHAVREAAGIAPAWGCLTGVSPTKLVMRHLADSGSAADTERILTEYYCVAPERARMAVEAAEAALAEQADLGPRDIDLYAGVPFCPTRCAYCSFVSQSVERSFALVEPYTEALVSELRAGGETVRALGLRPRSFYMGGGTPTTLSAQQLHAVLTALDTSFDLSACAERTVEAGRPDTVTTDKLAVLRDHGVTRVSVNPQSMEPHVLRAIGRCHGPADVERAMELVERAGFPHVNMDLIAGLPGDSPEGFRRSLDRCIAFGTDNLTVHTLALKKGSRILQEDLPIPAAEAVAEMLDYAASALRRAGYAPYYLYRQKYMSGSFENVGWCRPGGLCRYNVDIMAELCSILSFGAAGSTKMVSPDGRTVRRAFNAKYPTEYIGRPEKRLANQAAFQEFYKKYIL